MVELIVAETDTIRGINVKKYRSENRQPGTSSVLAVHGMFGGKWYFEKCGNYLSQMGINVYALDLRGHNGSFCLDFGATSILDYVQDVRKIVDDIIGLERIKPILLGHSMGGLIVQKFAETFPRLVQGLILLASAPPKGISAFSFSVLGMIVRNTMNILFNLPISPKRKDCFNLVLNNFPEDDSEADFAARKFISTPESGKAARELAFSLIPVDEKKINCPTLIVAGSKDKICPLSMQLKIREKYCFADYLQVENGHMMMLEPGWKEVISRIYTWIDFRFMY